MPLHLISASTPRWVAAVRQRLAPLAFSLVVTLGASLSAVLPALPAAAQGTVPSQPAAPEWLEPHGLSIVDMVGNVPEDQLRDAILVYETGTGLVQYVSGSRSGNSVVINTRITPRYGPGFTKVGCLGQPAIYDQWPAIVPESTMQLFADGNEITSMIDRQSRYTPAGLNQPSAGAGAYRRYALAVLPTGGSPLKIPANAGCEILVAGVHRNVTARFTFNAPPLVSVTFLREQNVLRAQLHWRR